MKAVMLSIRPKYVEKILNGEKIYEVRKTRLPLNTPIYVYCTNPNPKQSTQLLVYTDEYIGGQYVPHRWTFLNNWNVKEAKKTWDCIANGKVVAKIEFDKRTIVYADDISDYYGKDNPVQFKTIGEVIEKIENVCSKANITFDEMYRYANGNDLYFHHISKVEIIEPKEIGEFKHWKTKTIYSGMDCPPYSDEVLMPLSKAPQSYCYVEVNE